MRPIPPRIKVSARACASSVMGGVEAAHPVHGSPWEDGDQGNSSPFSRVDSEAGSH